MCGGARSRSQWIVHGGLLRAHLSPQRGQPLTNAKESRRRRLRAGGGMSGACLCFVVVARSRNLGFTPSLNSPTHAPMRPVRSQSGRQSRTRPLQTRLYTHLSSLPPAAASRGTASTRSSWCISLRFGPRLSPPRQLYHSTTTHASPRALPRAPPLSLHPISLHPISPLRRWGV